MAKTEHLPVMRNIKGMDLIFRASKGRKIESIRLEFHHLDSLSINWFTVEFSDSTETGDSTRPELLPRIQASWKIFMLDPSPILQRAPIFIYFRAWRILFQAYEPDFVLASKIEPIGKYLALKPVKQKLTSTLVLLTLFHWTFPIL